ncbi:MULTISPECIES: hypothetical protein [Halorussus]|uniref:hypothetical protein n=1 Tax=Halorussus TaxID=1070314 RepID=UPI000E219B76|nr:MULTISPECIES: hypothetical protein [Halorussus]NHN60300.1 hypothetical protein [Halorussus sp. JP-T4]
MSTPEQNLETAMDGSSDDEARERAIDELETANECDALADLARSADLAERYRERALEKLATPQCDSKLAELVDGGELPGSLRERAESLLEETPEDAGAGP